MRPDIAEVVKHFQFEGEFLKANLHGSGHINDTYATCFKTARGGVQRYILQRINHHVFNRPEEMMRNIEQVTGHLRVKIIESGGNPQRETLNLIPTTNGSTFHRTLAGDFWRGYVFIDDAQTYELAESMEQVYKAGRAYGNFLYQLSDFPVGQLRETIPDFHNTRKRFQDLGAAVENDECNRASSVKPEIEFVKQRAGDVSVLVELLERGELPERVTHNDTKFNNVLIDNNTGEGVCVIDLDTVMPGLSLYDFGDAIRSITNMAAEDERDFQEVTFSLEMFEHFTRGYLEPTRDSLTTAEKDYLAFSVKLLSLECGMRFLRDHLNGDVYFKIHRENHNLDRCRTQFKLVEGMEERYDHMVRIVEEYR